MQTVCSLDLSEWVSYTQERIDMDILVGGDWQRICWQCHSKHAPVAFEIKFVDLINHVNNATTHAFCDDGRNLGVWTMHCVYVVVYCWPCISFVATDFSLGLIIAQTRGWTVGLYFPSWVPNSSDTIYRHWHAPSPAYFPIGVSLHFSTWNYPSTSALQRTVYPHLSLCRRSLHQLYIPFLAPSRCLFCHDCSLFLFFLPHLWYCVPSRLAISPSFLLCL